MTTYAQQLADFAHDTAFAQLPPEVVDYTKLVILDSLVCGIAGAALERSRMMHAVVAALGGPPEATVFGLSQRLPAVHAVMANAEIMNVLDADDNFFTSSHFAVFSVAAGLAEAQRLGGSGAELIRSVALGFDINARLNLAMLLMDEVDGTFQWSPLQGMGFAAFGTGTSAAVMARLDRERMRNLFGLVSWLAPTSGALDMSTRRAFDSMKTQNNAVTAHAGMLAARLAAHGYIGDQECLNRDPGFLRAQGSLRTDFELLVSELGQKWWILEAGLKYYPSCRFTHAPIGMLRAIMRDEQLSPRDIERIEIHLNPMAYAMSLFREPPRNIELDHRAPLNAQFNIPYVMALAALGRRPGPRWYANETLADPEVWALASRIHTSVDAEAKNEVLRAFRQSRIRRFRKTRGSLSVWARGTRYERTTEYCDGDPWTPETRPTWDRIVRKFHDFCDDVLPERTIDEIVDQVRHLESVANVSTGIAMP